MGRGLNRRFTIIVRGGGGVKTKRNERMNQKNAAYVHRVTAVRVNACMPMISLRRSHSKPSTR